MSYFRSYFEKNNTIISGTHINTAKNPNTEIYYGSSYSRFIFKVDLEPLIERVNNDLVNNVNTKHYLNLYNTIFGDESFLGQKKTNNRDRASSFDLVLFQINEEWDEGVGFDYSKTEYDFTTGNDLYSTRPSNWFIKNNSVDGEWDYPGIYDGTSGYTVISTIHFDNGNENINVDITSTINNIIDGGTNYGFGLAFIPHYESLSLIDDLSVSFFTKYTQTFYEPYIESVFDDTIEDNRVNFIGGIEQNLYLYVTKGKNPYNLDSLPTVELYDSSNNIITGSTISAITKVKKGVYRVGITIDTNVNTCNGQYFYYDVWKNIIIDGFTVSDITQNLFHNHIHQITQLVVL